MDDFHDKIAADKRPNENPYVKHLLTLYSQSKSSNRGTRGLDEFARITYVKTKLDEELKPQIIQGKFRLVIISGNAGDGKTAFIQKMEEDVRAQCTAFEAKANGSRFIINGLEVHTNYDGSQDEGELQGDVVLETFFAEYRGNYVPTFKNNLTKVIAINQGRLLDFLQAHRHEYDWLYRLAQEYFIYEKRPTNQDICMVNLNARAVVDDVNTSRFNDSIFDKLVDAFTDEKMWSPCESCDIKKKCYIKHNIDALRHPETASQVRGGLKRLFLVTHMRGHLHITVRDLRSALSFILFNVSDCKEIHELLQDERTYISRFYYNAAFGSHFTDNPEVNDRLMALLAEIDVSRVANPKLDRMINFSVENVVTRKDGYDLEILSRFRDMRPEDPFLQSEKRDILDIHHKSIRRKVFFEDNLDNNLPKSNEMLPYTKFDKFASIMLSNEDLESIRRDIIFAISASERIYAKDLGRKYVCIKINKKGRSDVKSFYVHEAHSFSAAKDDQTVHPFVEFIPNTINFEEKRSKFRLRINLDLFEMLYKIAYGYSPTLNEMKGSFLNLLMFKKQLGSISSERLIITDNDRDFFEIKRVEERLVMEKMM